MSATNRHHSVFSHNSIVWQYHEWHAHGPCMHQYSSVHAQVLNILHTLIALWQHVRNRMEMYHFHCMLFFFSTLPRAHWITSTLNVHQTLIDYEIDCYNRFHNRLYYIDFIIDVIHRSHDRCINRSSWSILLLQSIIVIDCYNRFHNRL